MVIRVTMNSDDIKTNEYSTGTTPNPSVLIKSAPPAIANPLSEVSIKEWDAKDVIPSYVCIHSKFPNTSILTKREPISGNIPIVPAIAYPPSEV